jgi:hypothetical protein
MAIQDFPDESICGALYHPSEAILTTEDAAEDGGVADVSSKKWPICLLLGLIATVRDRKQAATTCLILRTNGKKQKILSLPVEFSVEFSILVALDDRQPSNASFFNQGDYSRVLVFQSRAGNMLLSLECCGGIVSNFDVKSSKH